MRTYSGNFGPSLLPIQLTTTQAVVRKIEFFPVKSWTSGTATFNGAIYYAGLETGALPYIVQTGVHLTLDYATDGTVQDARNYFVRGANGDGYFVLVHP